jgi:hypothetical protein
MLVRISDQLLKIGVVQRQGASSSALADLRKMVSEVIGGEATAAWGADDDAGGDVDEDDD